MSTADEDGLLMDDQLERPNVVFITVDSLQPDVLGAYGNRPSPSPFLDRLFDQGYTLERCFSVGYPTQFALVGLTSSTLPLDYGGYTYGIRGRPTGLAEPFADRGYDTAAFVAGGYIRRLYGFDRGFQRYFPAFPVKKWSNFQGVYLSSGSDLLADDAVYGPGSGSVTDSTVVESYTPFIGDCLDSFRTYCEDRLAEIEEPGSISYRSPAIHAVDFESAISLTEDAYASYGEDPKHFTEQLLREYPDIPFLDGFRVQKHYRDDVAVSKGVRIALQVELVRSLLHPSSKLRTPNSFGQLSTLLRDGLWGNWTSGGYLIENAMHWIRNREEPFFCWLHPFDIHRPNVFTWEVPDARYHREELAAQRAYLRTLRREGSTFAKDLRYLLTTRYTDLMIERFVTRLLEVTDTPPLIVLTADHGLSVRRERPGDHVRQFYNELLHVPVTFFHPNIEAGTFDGLCSGLDLPSTLLDVAGIDVPPGFDGRPIRALPTGGRDHVIAEDLGRGICDPTLKPVNISVQTVERKANFSGNLLTERELLLESVYDLVADSGETNPIPREELPREFERLSTIANQRATEIARSFDY